jgi:hypothetical protein
MFSGSVQLGKAGCSLESWLFLRKVALLLLEHGLVLCHERRERISEVRAAL